LFTINFRIVRTSATWTNARIWYKIFTFKKTYIIANFSGGSFPELLQTYYITSPPFTAPPQGPQYPPFEPGYIRIFQNFFIKSHLILIYFRTLDASSISSARSVNSLSCFKCLCTINCFNFNYLVLHNQVYHFIFQDNHQVVTKLFTFFQKEFRLQNFWKLYFQLSNNFLNKQHSTRFSTLVQVFCTTCFILSSLNLSLFIYSRHLTNPSPVRFRFNSFFINCFFNNTMIYIYFRIVYFHFRTAPYNRFVSASFFLII
jgi:hypothetical protein